MLTTITAWFITSKLGRGIALAGGVLLAIVTFGASQRSKGRQKAETDALRDSADRQEKGREAVQDLRDADRGGLAGQLRENDSDWK